MTRKVITTRDTMEHSHMVVNYKKFLCCQHIPFDSFLHYNEKCNPICNCGEEPIYEMIYGFCSCGEIISLSINPIKEEKKEEIEGKVVMMEDVKVIV